MPIETLDLEGFLSFLKERQGDQPASKFARQLGVSPQYLNDVYNDRRVPGEKILSAVSAIRSHTYTVKTDREKKHEK